MTSVPVGKCDVLIPFNLRPAPRRAVLAPPIGSATLFFIHIPKCAGTSFRRVLKHWFGPDVLFVDASGPAQIARAVSERETLPRAIAGHFAFGAHHAIPCRPYYVALVRHPLDRFVSLYKHARGAPDHHFHEAATRLELEPFYDFCLGDARARRHTLGIQCFFLSGARVFTDARAVIGARFSLVAPVESYDTFVEVCSRAVEKPSPKLAPSNVAAADPLIDFARTALAHRIEQDHREDLLLHDYVRSRFPV